ncbi:MAG: metal-dependent transcriptional regulator [Spirochaetales bacterium]|nr:metal-dependent transcriptional regulator [Spirochaetales bacterium]
MNENKITEEYLEAIWILLEKKEAAASPDSVNFLEVSRLKNYFGEQYNGIVLDRLQDDQFILLDDSSITYTELGREKSRQLIRAHRLAERLLYDVLGMRDYEVGACEFEHIIDTNLINGICTLLGHPRRCPDGMLIPEGECCKDESGLQPNPTVSVMNMRTGEAGRVAAVNADEDTPLHILESLQIRPGSLLKVHQKSPSIVVECGGGSVAIDESIAKNIHVWRLLGSEAEKAGQHRAEHGSRGRETTKRRRFRRRDEREEDYDCGPKGREREKKWRKNR